MAMTIAWALSPGKLCGNYNLMDVSQLRVWHLPTTVGIIEHPSVPGLCQALYTLSPMLSPVQMKGRLADIWCRVPG